MNISTPDTTLGMKRRLAAIGIAFTLLTGACTPGQRPLIEFGNTSTPEPTKTSVANTPTPTGTPLPTNTRASTPTNAPIQTPTNRPALPATPDLAATITSYENQLRFGALFNTVQMIEILERECTSGCLERGVFATSFTSSITSGIFFDVGIENSTPTLPDLDGYKTYKSESGRTYVIDQGINANVGEIVWYKLFTNAKKSRPFNYVENKLLNLIKENREQGIGEFNNFKVLLEKLKGGIYSIVVYMENDYCAVIPAPTNTATPTPTPIYSTPTVTPIPTQYEKTPEPKKVPPTPASTVGPQATPRSTPRLPEEIIIIKDEK